MLKKAAFSPAQPWRAKTRLVPGKAAANEEARRTFRYIEPLSEERTMLADFFSILLSGLFQLRKRGRVGLKLRQRVSLVERDHSFETSSC